MLSYYIMDLPVKIAIGLFLFTLLILFFKYTKQMKENYLEEKFKHKVDFNEIVNRNYQTNNTQIDRESQQLFDIPLENLNPDDIKWVIKE